ncbi:MAG: carbohydrate ABC transporter permease [Firmicutes bacterium]|nr:carbohydrate ABC transporter permease [Bacillota bacterium]
MEAKGKRKAIYIIISAVFGIYALSLIFPFAYTLLNSFKTSGEFGDFPMAWPKRLLDQNDLFRNYRFALSSESGLVGMFINSAIITGVGTVTAALSPAIVAYVLSKYRFRLNTPIFTLAVIFMVVPNVGTAVSAYVLYVKLGFLNTYHGMFIQYAGPFGGFFFLLYGYFKGISWSYAEAARIDGAGNFGIFFRIMIPQALPGLSIVALLSGIGIWNDYYTAWLFMPNGKTIATGIQNMSTRAITTDAYPQLFAAMILSLIPVLLVFALLQKQLINNTMAGGLKG